MRWSPHEDDQEQDNGFDGHGTCHSSPADHWRESASGTANDNILRRGALQPHGIDYGIKEDGEGQKASGEPVDQQAQHQGRGDRQGSGQSSRPRRE